MKNMRKLATLLLALAMVLSLAAPVFASEVEDTPATYSITINNSADGHIYEAYQIFAGDLGNANQLTNITWGSGVSEAGQTAMGDAVAKAESLTSTSVAATFAKEVAPYLTTAAGSTSTVTDGKYVISGLNPGYYLVKDQNGSLNGDNDSYTSYILVVVENTEVNPKSSVPTVQKKVDDINDSNDTENAVVWNDSADYDIGDSVPFQLKATLANNVSAYKSYKIVFHDTLSKGLTFEAITKVTIDGKEVTSGYIVKTTENSDGTTSLDIVFGNIKAQGGTDSSVVIVEYTAELNEDAVLGNEGNPNYVYLEYSNNPNWAGDGDLDDDGIPNDEDDDDDNDGTPDNEDDDDDNDGTPDDEDDDDDNDGTPDDKEDEDDEEGDEPTGNTPEDKVIVFTYKVIVNKVDGEKKPLEGAGFTLYKKNADGEYVAIGEEIVGGELTTFTWSGLDDGDYKLVETTTPAGYNTIDDIEFTISATHDLTWETEAKTAILTALTGGDLFTGDVSTGAVTADVVNQAGATLPETGGIGTTIFYILGAVMVLGAAVLLVTKKRMAA